MLITFTLLMLVLGGLVGLLGLIATVVVGIKNAQAAGRLSAVWAAFAGMYIYMLTQADYSAVNVIALAVIAGTLVYLALQSEVELAN